MFKVDVENNQLLASEEFMRTILCKELNTGVYEVAINDIWHYFKEQEPGVYTYYMRRHTDDEDTDITHYDPLYQSYVDELVDHINNEISYFKSMYGDDILNN